MQRAVIAGIFSVLVGVGLAVGLMQERQGDGATLEISTDPSRALVNVTGPEGFMSMLDLSGPETLTDLPPGRYFIVATSPDHSVGQAEIELSQGATESVALSLETLADAGRATDGGSGEQTGQGPEAQQQDGQQQNGQQQNGQQQDGQQQNAQQSQVGGGGQAQSGQQGEQAYQQHCAQCHGGQGEGGSGPALAGNQNLQQAQMVIDQILNGGGGMPAFGEQLSDEQIAAIATHEMNSWGNQFGEVSPDQVQQQRGGGRAQQQTQQQGQQQAQQQSQQQSQQQQPEGQSSQQGQQQAQGQQAEGQQAEGQQIEGQEGQGRSEQPDMQVQRGGDATRIEIVIPGASDAPVSLNLQLEIGASQARAGGPSQSPEGEQVAGGGQSAGQSAGQSEQAQEQGQQQGAQQQGAQQEGVQQQGVQQQGQQAQDQQEQGQQEQGQAGQSSQQPDPASQGTLQIEWVQPAGARVTITGPDGFSRQTNLTGGAVFEGLRAGSYTVTATSPGYESASKQVEVEARQTATVSLSLQQQSGQQRAGQQQQAGQQQSGQQQAGQQQAGQQQTGQQQSDEQRSGQQQDGQQEADQQQSDQRQADQQVAGGGQAQQGSQIYAQQCAQCHGQEGEGGAGPALAGNQAMQDVQAVVTQILEGGGGMPAFGNQLSDEQVAAVATHEMNSWGNQFGEVTPNQVSQQRNGAQQQDGQQQDGQQQNDQQQSGQQTGTSSSQQEASWFTAEQARRGMQEYASHCAVCHGGGLQGRASYPALVGEDFLGKWQGRTAAELFEYISTEMPQDRPGKLGHLTYTYLSAYVLDQNGLPAGQTELAPESGRLSQLILPGPSGDGGAQQEGQPPAPVGQETEQPEQDQQ